MFSSDRPISKSSEDLLGRYAFSKRMATAIANLATGDSTVVGLYGAWGSGKTSVINMVEEELEQSNSGMLVIRFNPWNRIESSNLITEFFQVGGADKKLDTPVSGLESACTRWRPGSSPWRPSRRGSA